ncbi:unnamed protein product [Phaeothamnion confervicola]
MAVCSAAQEAVYLRSLFSDPGFPQVDATVILEDNQSAIALANAAVEQWHARARHMDVCYKFIMERVRSGEIKLHYIKTTEQLADMLTKTLGPMLFRKLSAFIMRIRA